MNEKFEQIEFVDFTKTYKKQKKAEQITRHPMQE